MHRPILAAIAALLLTSSASAAPPNIVYILADDLGYTDLGCQGSKYYETPNIDRLAQEGVRFTRYHNCQNCQPTRAALMSGQYSPRTGTYTVGGIDRFNWQSRPLRPVDNVNQLSRDKITIAETLKSSGYATAMFGKWHLGDGQHYHPADRGFDEAIVSNGVHFNFPTNPKTEYPEGQYLADFLTDRAVEFIQRKKGEPFFLYLPHFAVHAPHQAKPELIEKFNKKAPVGGHNKPVYAAMIASIDESVGRILQTLEELKLADNTLVIFSSDNGGVGGYHRDGVMGGNATDNLPLRSGKGSLYEGGTRVPFIVRWPGKAPAGTKCDEPTIHVDLFPTLVDIAGAKAPKDYALDGKSLAPLFRKPDGALARDGIFHHFPGYLGSPGNTWRTLPVGVIDSGDWKLMQFYEDNRLELYNLKDDIGEQKNLAAEMPDKAKELLAKLDAWRASVGAKMPTKNTDIRPVGERQKQKKAQKKKQAEAA